MNQWCEYQLVDLQDYKERAYVCNVPIKDVRKDVLAIVLKDSLEVAHDKAAEKYKHGTLPEFFFSKKGYGTLSRKAYIQEVGGRPVTNFWSFEETGHTDEASRLLKAIFKGTAVFDTPKPPRLIERILHIAGDKNAIIIDSFAGSGTTAHAVLNRNKADGGNRKFILVEMGDYADNITAERVKRVIDGYGQEKQAVEGTGGNFSYYELGEPLFKGENLNEYIGIDHIREYIWYMETRQNYVFAVGENSYYLGVNKGTAYYFYYQQNEVCTLNYAFLSTIREKAEGYVIYADRCALSEEELAAHSIVFKKIPRDISRL